MLGFLVNYCEAGLTFICWVVNDNIAILQEKQTIPLFNLASPVLAPAFPKSRHHAGIFQRIMPKSGMPIGSFQCQVPKSGTPIGTFQCQVPKSRTPIGTFQCQVPKSGTPIGSFQCSVPKSGTPVGSFQCLVPKSGMPIGTKKPTFPASNPLPEPSAMTFPRPISTLPPSQPPLTASPVVKKRHPQPLPENSPRIAITITAIHPMFPTSGGVSGTGEKGPKMNRTAAWPVGRAYPRAGFLGGARLPTSRMPQFSVSRFKFQVRARWTRLETEHLKLAFGSSGASPHHSFVRQRWLRHRRRLTLTAPMVSHSLRP